MKKSPTHYIILKGGT